MTNPQPIRDDTQEPFSLTGAGPLTQELDNWSDMHRTFPMPDPRPPSPFRQLAERLHKAAEHGDHQSFLLALARLNELTAANINSGNAAPIQGQD